MPFWDADSNMGPSNRVLEDGVGVYWHHFANTIDRSVRRRRCGCRYRYCSNVSVIVQFDVFAVRLFYCLFIERLR